MEQINLSTIPGVKYPVVHISQNDIGRTFKLNLFENDVKHNLDGTETLYIFGYKPDGNVFSYLLPSVIGNVVTVTVEEQMSVVYGDVICEISINKGTDQVNTNNFVISVEQSPNDYVI